jgi:deoxyribodipyrimidine photolyase-related protein
VNDKMATVIFPHQLFQNHSGPQKDASVYLFEEVLFVMQHKRELKKIRGF